jgi:hypothetical protein
VMDGDEFQDDRIRVVVHEQSQPRRSRTRGR